MEATKYRQSFQNHFQRFRGSIPLINNWLLVGFAFFMTFYRPAIEGILALVVLLWLVEGRFRDKLTTAYRNKVVLGFVLLFGVYHLGLLWSDNVTRSFNYLLHLELKYLLLPLIFVTVLRYEFIHRIITAFLLGMLVNEAVSYGIFFGWLSPTKYGHPGDPTPFMSHLPYSLLLAFTSLMILYRLFEDRLSRTEKILHVIFFLTVTTNLFIQGGRAGQLLFFVTMVVMFLFLFRKNLVKAILIPLVILSGVFSLAYDHSDTFKYRLNKGLHDIKKIEKGNYYTSWGNRVASAIASYEVFKQNPLLGVGTGDHIRAVHGYIKKKRKDLRIVLRYKHLHNQYSNIATQFGLLGLGVLFYLFYQIFRYPQEDRFLKHLQLMLLVMTIIYFGIERPIGGYFGYIFIVSMFAFTLVRKEEGKKEVAPDAGFEPATK